MGRASSHFRTLRQGRYAKDGFRERRRSRYTPILVTGSARGVSRSIRRRSAAGTPEVTRRRKDLCVGRMSRCRLRHWSQSSGAICVFQYEYRAVSRPQFGFPPYPNGSYSSAIKMIQAVEDVLGIGLPYQPNGIRYRLLEYK